MVLSMAADKAMLDCNCPLGLLESDQSSCMGICTVSQQLYCCSTAPDQEVDSLCLHLLHCVLLCLLWDNYRGFSYKCSLMVLKYYRSVELAHCVDPELQRWSIYHKVNYWY